jgi:hypothetical protein
MTPGTAWQNFLLRPVVQRLQCKLPTKGRGFTGLMHLQTKISFRYGQCKHVPQAADGLDGCTGTDFFS